MKERTGDLLRPVRLGQVRNTIKSLKKRIPLPFYALFSKFRERQQIMGYLGSVQVRIAIKSSKIGSPGVPHPFISLFFNENSKEWFLKELPYPIFS